MIDNNLVKQALRQVKDDIKYLTCEHCDTVNELLKVEFNFDVAEGNAIEGIFYAECSVCGDLIVEDLFL